MKRAHRSSRIGRRGLRAGALAACVIAGAALAAGCGGGGGDGTAAASGAVTVGDITAVTGPYAAYGTDTSTGLRIAAREINASGGIKSNKVKLDFLDSQSQVAQAVSLARDACRDAVLLLGPITSQESQSVFPVSNGMRCPTMSGTAAADGLASKSRPWTFQLSEPASIQTPDGTGKFYDAVKPQTATVVIDKSDASSTDQGDLAVKTLKEKGVQVTTLGVTESGVDFAPIVTRIANGHPDAIVISANSVTTISLVRQLHKQGLGDTPTLVTAAGYSSQLVGLPSSINEGYYVYTQFWPSNPDPKVQAFVEKFNKARGSSSPSQLATEGYDMLMIARDAYSHCNVTPDVSDLQKARECVRDYIAGLKGYKGLTGTVTMTDQGFAKTSLFLLQIRNQALKKVAG